jgi:hypothetical protein
VEDVGRGSVPASLHFCPLGSDWAGSPRGCAPKRLRLCPARLPAGPLASSGVPSHAPMCGVAASNKGIPLRHYCQRGTARSQSANPHMGAFTTRQRAGAPQAARPLSQIVAAEFLWLRVGCYRLLLTSVSASRRKLCTSWSLVHSGLSAISRKRARVA